MNVCEPPRTGNHHHALARPCKRSKRKEDLLRLRNEACRIAENIELIQGLLSKVVDRATMLAVAVEDLLDEEGGHDDRP